MKKLEIAKFSDRYHIRKLNRDDVDMIFAFCGTNPQYFEYCGQDISADLIERDLTLVPPGISLEDKYYVGFFENGMMAAFMDLVAGYPCDDCAFIGFFMMHGAMQGRGAGSRIISDVLSYLKGLGFRKCQLGIDKDNPQSRHFWKKNGFAVIREIPQEEGTLLLAQKEI